MWIPVLIIFDLTRPGIEPGFAVLVADALSTQPLIVSNTKNKTYSVVILVSSYYDYEFIILEHFFLSFQVLQKIPKIASTIEFYINYCYCVYNTFNEFHSTYFSYTKYTISGDEFDT